MNNQNNKRYIQLMNNVSTNTSILYPINPWIPLWWSAAFPGYGHCFMNNYLIGYSLIIFEFTINNLAKINQAIYFSMIGDFTGAAKVIDLRFFYLYIGVYIFTMFDSYRRAVDLNNTYILSYRKTETINSTSVSSFSVNGLNKVSPSIAMFWEMMMPGLGSLYLNHIVSFFFSVITWVLTIYSSRFYVGLYYSFIGEFEKAKSVVDPQWYLFIPSIYAGYIHFSYLEAVKNNIQYKLSQSQFLKSQYQSRSFKLPFLMKKGETPMYIVASFEHSVSIEIALTELEQLGIQKADILALPLNVRTEKTKLFDNAHYSDGVSFVDLATILGSIFMLLGGIYGFVLKHGPVLWALIGLVIGGVLGFIIKLIVIKKKPTLDIFGRTRATEVFMMVKCSQEHDRRVKDIFWRNKALGIANYNEDPNW
ncbi:hypothetical protein [Paenibacillus radicis (ex Xue et al. 2023)]|uniref:Uncharacterized protein n=1 Tax=Paenibacillus radicis (ex Xue et al. 2023) TaxID=2972489 RepID=A0ABT1YBV7_9BACL|nr:hypothetical protein [Paenibacillus radicis (ex Xue et al. 2023)]MCR8630245.1 hypothetical protein [Paenibacillus radicis (ex Xue et al. 2023)]